MISTMEAGPEAPVRRRLSILLVTTSFPRSGSDWTGLFMYKLVQALAARDDVELHLWAPPGPRPPGVRDAFIGDDAAWLNRLLDAGGIAHLLRRDRPRAAWFGGGLLWRLWRLYRSRAAVDLVHVAWLQNALPLALSRRRALLISVLGTDYALLQRGPWAPLMRRVLQRHRSALAPNAPWMQPRLEALFGGVTADIRCVPFGVDRAWFQVSRQSMAGGPRRWLVVLRVTVDKIGPLFDWGRLIAESGDELHLFGPRQDALDIPSWIHYHGPVTAQALQQDWFPRAAGLISLSQHDEGRPQVILEAMAASLPIVASPIAAHRELVRDAENGYLVGNRVEFEQALARLRNEALNRDIGERGRAWVRSFIGDWDACAARYVQLCHALVGPA